MSNFDFALVMVFFVIHSIAAHWLYSNVPYDVWFQAVFGQGLNEIMGWTRNHFDRLVHFCYGFCFAPAIIGYAKIKGATRRKTAWLIAICAIMVTSLWYEWFEWLIAATLSPSDAEAYNGQQGDMWDAHKDMLSATIGALIWFFPRQFPRNFK
jgi:putative membrane protein